MSDVLIIIIVLFVVIFATVLMWYLKRRYLFKYYLEMLSMFTNLYISGMIKEEVYKIKKYEVLNEFTKLHFRWYNKLKGEEK